MLSSIPSYIYILFLFSVFYVLGSFFRAIHNRKVMSIIIGWGCIQSMIGLSGFYEYEKSIPPRFVWVIFPVILIIILVLFSKKLRDWMVRLDLKKLMWIHIVRIPVEIVLFGLYTADYIPKLMTFEGQNFDIFAGITALFIIFVGFHNGKMRIKLLWIWHIFSFILLMNIVVLALLSAPTPFQQLALDQPNIAILYFPFLLLPGIIVPIVLIANLTGFVILTKVSQE